MKGLRILLRSLFILANVVVVVLWIASAYSDRVSPETSLLFSYLGLAFPVLCVLNLCFVICWLFLLKWKFLLLSVGAFLLCWGSIKAYFPFHSPQEVNRKEVLKVLTYNVMAFGYMDHTKNKPNPILQYIANSDADIVCLQEYSALRPEKGGLTSSKINEALRKFPYRSVFYFNENSVQRSGIAVYSKYPILKSRVVKYASDHNGSSVHEVDIKGKRLTLINNHLESFKLTMADRTLYSTFIKGIRSEGLVDLTGAFTQRLGPAFRIRAKQAEVVAEEVKNAKGEYVLVCGDFNDTPISYAHHMIEGDDLIDAFSASGRGLGVTYNRNSFWFRIDHILHSPNIVSFNCSVDSEIDYSDHYPLWCYLKLE